MTDAAKILVSIVCPVFNEQDNIDLFITEVKHSVGTLNGISLEFIFVNDGSTDNTLSICLARLDQDCIIKVCDLSRNFGKEAALTAGLRLAEGCAVIPMDVDLQDPPEILVSMIEKWKEGFEVVFARRIDRSSDFFLKRLTANLFYFVHNKISGNQIPNNVGDFRLMDRLVVDAVNEFNERNRFMKGLLSWVGFRSTYVDYKRPTRSSGQSKFNWAKLFGLAVEGITSFSTAPLRLCSYVGLLIASISFGYASYIILRVTMFGIEVPGYASIMVLISILGGIQLIAIGFLGEYIGRTYFEVKGRPLYVVRKIHINTQRD